MVLYPGPQMPPHPPEFTDTDPRAMEVWVDLLRRMTPGEKLAASLRATDSLLKRWESEARLAYPKAGDHEIKMRVAARHIPRDLMLAAFNWDPAAYGIVESPPEPVARIDMDYVRRWAEDCGVVNLLQSVLRES